MRDPKRSFPSFSARPVFGYRQQPPNSKTFWSPDTKPAVTRIQVPPRFFGTKGDVGTEADLELLKSSIQRQSTGPGRVRIP